MTPWSTTKSDWVRSRISWIRWALVLSVIFAGSRMGFAQPYNSHGGCPVTVPPAFAPRFQVLEKKGCAGLVVTITNLLPGECTGAQPCTMNFGDGSPLIQNQFTHTYATAGTYNLSVNYQSLGADCITITIVPNTQPNFEIYSCSTRGARIRVFDNAYQQYEIDFGDGSPVETLPFSNNILSRNNTYGGPPPVTFTTSVRGINLAAADNCTPSTQPFTPLAALPTPSINTLTSVDVANVTMNFTTAPNILYKLQIAINTGAFQTIQDLYGVNTFALSNLNLDANYYCFRLWAYNPCTPSGGTTFSNVVCTSKFSVTAVSDINKLAWSTGGSAINYIITRNNSPYGGSGTSKFFDDTDAICKTNYCYRVTTDYGGGRTSVSLEKCATAFSDKVPTAIDNVSAEVSASGVELTWDQDPDFITTSYSIFRSSAGGAYAPYNTASSTAFADNVYVTSGMFCYVINYIDRCDNQSASGAEVCPIQLTASNDKYNAITLTWSPYTGWKNGVKNYLLKKFNLQGNVLESTTLTDLTFLDNIPDAVNQYVRFVVTANPNEVGLTPSISNEVEIIKEANLYYPTAFTPNNDALNDGFLVSGQYIAKMNLSIFDRWGAMIYSSAKKDLPWDGKSSGRTMPASTYIWKAEITDLAGRTFSREGTVALIRN